jgi:hypothetical protein
MSTISDILNPTFLMCLGIILISIACLVIYFENKLREQNHKMSSMLGLVTSLTDEVNHTKKFLSRMASNMTHNPNVGHTEEVIKKTLIEVSDDDDDDEDDDDDDEDDDDDDDDDEDDDDEDDDDEEENDDDDEEEGNATPLCIYDANKTKILKIDINPPNAPYEEENLEELNLVSETESDSESDSIDSKLAEHPNTEFSKMNLDVDGGAQLIDDIITTELKTIDVTNLDELVTVDYKKMSVQKLKTLVGEKGLVADCSKMKKNDLVKLLETV